MLDSMYETTYIYTGLYPKLDLRNTNKLRLQLQEACDSMQKWTG